MFNFFATHSFHDVRIENITTFDKGVVLSCKQGLYLLHNTTQKSSPCDIHICINDFDVESAFHHIEVKLQRKRKIKEISFNTFLNMVNKYGFKVYLDYFCVSSSGIKLEGLIKKCDISFIISDITNIDIIYQN